MNTIGVYTLTTTPAGYKADLVKAFAKGVGKLANDKWRADLVPDDQVKNGYSHVFCFNFQRTMPAKENRTGLILRRRLIERYEPEGKIWYFDSNILGTYEKKRQDIKGSFVRIAYGKVYPNETNYLNDNPKSEKWDYMKRECDIEIKPYKRKGDKIYICCNRGSGGYSGHGVNAAEWAIETAQKLRQHTDRPIVVRTHSGMGHPTAEEDIKKLYEAKNHINNFDIHSPGTNYPDLVQEVKDSYAVVIFTSSSGAPAIIEGKPLFVTHPTGYLTPMNAGELSDIENPNYDLDRDKFLHGLGEAHWTLEQIENGDYFKKFIERQND